MSACRNGGLFERSFILRGKDGVRQMKRHGSIYVAGHESMIGSAIVRRLRHAGFDHLVLKSSSELDLTDQSEVRRFLVSERPDHVFVAAARVGGILANSRYPADFMYENLMIQNNIIHSACQVGTKRLLFLGSSCVYPQISPQPIKEEYLLSGQLEPTSEPYAIAKIAGVRMCQSYNRQYGTHYVCAIPSDVYGPHDDFDPETSHVLPSLIARMHKAKLQSEKTVTLWGTGSPRREFLYVDDLADACVFLMDNYEGSEMVNVGYGEEVRVRELGLLVKDIIGYEGEIVFDRSKPDGTPRKFLDPTRLREMGWRASICLEDGIGRTYEWYRNHVVTS